LGLALTTILFALPAMVVGWRCAFSQRPGTKNEPETPAKASFWQDSKLAVRNVNLRWILLAAVVAAGVPATGSSPLSFLSISVTISAWDRPPLVCLHGDDDRKYFGPLLGGKLVDRWHPQKVLWEPYGWRR
jgi:hypothetical protein